MNVTWSQPWQGVVSTELTQALERISQRRAVKAGDILYRRGDTNRDMFGVVSGVVRMMIVAADGREMIAGLYTPGTWFGEVSVFDRLPRPTDAVVTQGGELLVASASRLEAMLADNPVFYKELAQVICGKLRVAFDFLEDSFLPVSVRICRRLLDLCETHGVAMQQGLLIDLRLSQIDLAQMLGLARQSVNREIKLLEAEGLIGQTSGRIFVRDKAALQACLNRQIHQAGGS